jgi:protoporphyrinogen oxidase
MLGNDKKIIIIGAGPAGLTAAYELSKVGVDSIVLEKDEIVGGISRTVNYKNYHFDIGGHRFFTKIKAVEEMWREVLSNDLLRRKRLSRIYYNRKFFYYPLRPFNALFGLGIWNSFLIMASYLHSQLFPSKTEETFEQWVSNRFGKRLYSIFFKTYTEKVWGIPCDEIRAEWASQRIKGLSLATAVKDALLKNQNNTNNRKDVVKTLIDEFDYPKFGPGMMWQAVARIVQENGSEILMGAQVEGLVWSGNRVEALELARNGQTELVIGSDFISSMPIREAIQKFKPTVPNEVLDAANDLKYRDFLTVALIVNKSDIFPDNWIYVHDPRAEVGRIQNFKNWSPHMVDDQDKTCLGLEYFCFENDTLWEMDDEDLVELAKNDLEILGLADKSDVEEGVAVRMPKAYPIYDSTYQESLGVVRRFLGRFENFQVVGRNGMHRYNNQDHSMLTAMLAAENILGASHDLWQVNEEQEYHEEIREEVSRESPLDKLFTGMFPRVDKLGFAAALGTVSGVFIFLATLWLVFRGDSVTSRTLHLLNQYFFGYTVTVKGAFIGMAYSFVWGFLFGWLFAYLRNIFIAFYIFWLKRRIEILTFKDFLDHF